MKLEEQVAPLAVVMNGRQFTTEPCGPLEMLVMRLAREVHDNDHPDCDWFGHSGSTATSFCRCAIEIHGLDWKWVMAGITAERLREDEVRR